MAEAPAPPPVPNATEITRALSDAMFDVEGTVDRITVERATDHEYMARVFFVGVEDYEPAHLRFRDDS